MVLSLELAFRLTVVIKQNQRWNYGTYLALLTDRHILQSHVQIAFQAAMFCGVRASCLF